MQKNTIKRIRQFAGHSDSDLKNSWYWNVLLKNMGNWTNAKKAIEKSKKRADLYYDLGLRIRI